MRGRTAFLAVVVLLLGGGSGALAATLSGWITYGHAATFQGFPKLTCLDKAIGTNMGVVPAGTEGVVCFTNLSTGSATPPPSYYVVFELHRLAAYSPSDRLVFHAPLK